ncbi:uncharacterized protein METZ01_LOCUS99947 [marine metagenome]|uniref:2-dehydropantoate 2-reductase n=1 Tax=marine metagenome TaxID=408172 RepID=A0A381W5A9_9ZZZZ
MKITVLGCGAMGSIYAALLATAGHEVTAVDANSDHVAAINANGLRVSGASGDRTVNIKAQTEVPLTPAELLIIAVKGAHVASASEKAFSTIDANSLVLTIQNGLGSSDIVADRLGPDRLIVGVAQGFGASLPEPGHTHHSDMKAIRMGAYANLNAGQVALVSQLYTEAGFDAEPVADIQAMQWDKLICNCAYSAPAALTGMTVGDIMDDPNISVISRNAATEAWETARALKVKIDIPDPVEHVREFASRMPEAKPSVLLDIEAGRASEVGMINGAVPREAVKVGLTAPVNDILTRLVLAIEQSRFPGA